MTVSKYQIFYLSALSMLGFVATDMYLPAFDAMQTSLATGPQQMALSLTVFLAGLGIGQIVWGMLSDKYGDRNSLIMGLLIFTAASFGLTQSTEVSQLLGFRFVQAVGVCAPAVIWQAMVIRRYPEKTSQQLLATIMPLVALSPALAPQLGVLLLSTFGWESIFTALTVIGGLLIVASLAQPATKVTAKQSSFTQDVGNLVKSKVYMGNITIYAFASAVFFAYLTGMPEIMNKLGYSPKDIGLSFVPQTIAFIIGGFLGKKCTPKFGSDKTLFALLIVFTVATSLVGIFSQTAMTTIWPLLIPFCFVAMVNGALYPIVVSKALSSAKESPATAAGFQNSFQIAISSLASALVAAFAYNALEVTGAVIMLCTLGLWFGYLLAAKATKTVHKTELA
ncbi:purine nucleoside transporter PunC [Vibrio sp. qd031]|uniref:purine nucleoside transporter PunC n=1 Tax=Vibrio sp. qd031 TaxID=1603038 RepID=UPI000A115617|nr:purine nucleoside transporter PunC [Vibrio sp. qd031]